MSTHGAAQRRSQITLEYLVVFSIALSLLAFFIPQIQNLSDTGTYALSVKQAELAGQRIADNANEVAFMGEGNSRTIAVVLNQRTEFSLEGNFLTVSYLNYSVSYPLFSEAILDFNSLQGEKELRVYFEDGKIHVGE